jgi:hypothetical protein
MAVRKLRRDSRVFEQINLDRLKKCAATVSRAEELVRGAKHQIEQSKKLLEELRQDTDRRSQNGKFTA